MGISFDKKAAVRQEAGPAASLVILPTRGWRALNLRELWQYRELLYFLTWRDLKVRYKQTAIGALWAVIQPLFTMVVFTIFLGKLAKVPSDNLPYPLFAFSALVPWQFFSNALSQSSLSTVNSANLIRKIYFPRLAIPVSSVLSGAVDFLLAFVMLLAIMLYYGVRPTWNALLLPLLLLLVLLAALAVGLWLSALNAQYRDVRNAIPFMVQAWMFATPIAYPSSLLAEPWRTLYAVNPMTGIVEGFRWALLGMDSDPSLLILVSGVVTLCLLVSGAFYFRRMERIFADVV